MSKGKPHSKWSHEAQKGEFHVHTIGHNLLYINYQKKFTLYNSAGRRKNFLLAQQQPSQWETAATQSVRSHHNPELLLHSNELLFKTDNLNFLLSSVKEHSPSLFSRLAYSLP